MNDSTQRLLNRLLEKVRKVYGYTDFQTAYDMAMQAYSTFLGLKDMVNNPSFNEIAEKELTKAYRYVKQLNYGK